MEKNLVKTKNRMMNSRNLKLQLSFIFLISSFLFSFGQKTRTLYDKNGRKVITYSFVNDISTDCSVPQEVINVFPTEYTFYSELFANACANHDYGWSQAPWQKAGFKGTEGKTIADERFRVDMQKACDARFKSVWDAPRKAACYSAAETWFAAVYHKIDEGWQSKQNRFTADQNLKVVYSMYNQPQSTNYAFSVDNKSIWLISFRTKVKGSWSSWKNVNAGSSGSISRTGSVEDYQIQYKDIATWKDIPGKPAISSSPGSQTFIVSGSTFTGIKMN